jgi:hypothetical protein
MTSDPLFEIGARGVPVENIVEQIRAAVAKKLEEGAYSDARIARAERANLDNLKDDENFFAFYIECLRDAVFVDINDFEIYERRRFWAPVLVAFKRAVWTMLKFYTYRLWSQQNQVNGLLLSATEEIESRCRSRIRNLEERLRKLEAEISRDG